jgi:hypothetical protein
LFLQTEGKWVSRCLRHWKGFVHQFITDISRRILMQSYEILAIVPCWDNRNNVEPFAFTERSAKYGFFVRRKKSTGAYSVAWTCDGQSKRITAALRVFTVGHYDSRLASVAVVSLLNNIVNNPVPGISQGGIL